MISCRCTHSDCILCEGMLGEGRCKTQICDIRGLVAREFFHPGEPLFYQGEPTEWLYVLRDGYVKLVTNLVDGREQVVCVSNSGQVLGFDSLQRRQYAYTAQALTYVSLCAVRVPDMWRVIEGNPLVSRQAIQMLGQELEQSRARICDLGLKSAMERVASFLLRLGCVPSATLTPVLQPLSRSEIAEMLGLTIGTVSRCITQLQRDGIVHAPRGQLRVLDPERLRAMTGEHVEPELPANAVATAR